MTAITGANLAAGASIFGFVDQEMRCRFFVSSGTGASTQTGALHLPTLAVPNFVPTGYVQLGSSALYVLPAAGFVPDPSGGAFAAAQAGMLFFTVSCTAGSPDQGSPVNFWVDQSTLSLMAAATAEFP